MKEIRRKYKDVFKVIGRYWKSYGGYDALIMSPYLHVSIILGTFLFPYKFLAGKEWWNFPIGTLPSILGFSIAGYAVLLAVGDDSFKKLMADKDDNQDENNPSAYLSFGVTFLHFMFIQILAILLAIGASTKEIIPSQDSNLLWNCFSYFWGIFGFSMFFYAILSAIASILAIYRLLSLHEKHLQKKK